eukprot:gene7910-38606_t
MGVAAAPSAAHTAAPTAALTTDDAAPSRCDVHSSMRRCTASPAHGRSGGGRSALAASTAADR